MKKLFFAFKPVLTEITRDFMLIACLIAPVLLGVLFKFCLPMLENLLCKQFEVIKIISPYYILFDLLLAIMTPILFCFAGVLIILEELDCGTAKYLVVTPLGKSGYLFSRIGIPSIIAFVYDILVISFFSLTNINFTMNILLCLNGTLLAVVCGLFVASFAKNKIEGMALIKLCGILIIGIPVAFFIVSPIRYIFAILPSFWIAELFLTNNIGYFLLSALISIIFIITLYIKFRKKLI